MARILCFPNGEPLRAKKLRQRWGARIRRAAIPVFDGVDLTAEDRFLETSRRALASGHITQGEIDVEVRRVKMRYR